MLPALITGAASGIGRGIAKALVAEAVRPVLSDVAVEAGRALTREMNATFIPADLADPTAPRKLFDAAEKTLGFVSILVHSASPRRRENETALAATESRMGFDGNVWIARRFCPRASSRGANAGAQNQRAHTPRNLPHYSATKAGQTMIVKELARALGADGIRVNAIAPAAIPGGGFDADTTALQRMIPLGRTGTPDDIAEMAVALLCDRFSRYVTGTTVAVDGGLSLYNWIPFRTLG